MAIEQNLSNNSSKKLKNGQDVARYLVYFSKLKQRQLVYAINIANISGLGIYRKHKAACDKCLLLQSKYQIDLVSYLKFFTTKFNINDSNIDRIVDPTIVTWYANELQILSKYEKVYGYVLKSVDNVVNDCIKENYSSVKEYLKYLISENKLADKYLSGKISCYYLAGIKNLSKIVKKMNILNQDTLNEIVIQQDKLVSDMQDAFTHFKMSRINVLSYTDAKLIERLSE